MAVGYLVDAVEMRGRGAERNGPDSAISADRVGLPSQPRRLLVSGTEYYLCR
jgi:hypothetical protein